jgi:hypothetical protein
LQAGVQKVGTAWWALRLRSLDYSRWSKYYDPGFTGVNKLFPEESKLLFDGRLQI